MKQPTLTRPFDEKDFLKSIDKNNKFCRQFMDGKVDKTRELYKKFVKTSVFRNFDASKREEVVSLNLR